MQPLLESATEKSKWHGYLKALLWNKDLALLAPTGAWSNLTIISKQKKKKVECKLRPPPKKRHIIASF